MGDPTTRSLARDGEVNARPGVADPPQRDVSALLERLANDRYSADDLSHGGDPVTEPVARWSFNAGSMHAESLILRWINEARLPVALEELRDAPAIDLRPKATLTASVPLSDDERLFWEAL